VRRGVWVCGASYCHWSQPATVRPRYIHSVYHETDLCCTQFAKPSRSTR
jgi:hypothetical protein